MEDFVETESRNRRSWQGLGSQPTNGRNGRRTEVEEEWIPVSPQAWAQPGAGRLGHPLTLAPSQAQEAAPQGMFRLW